MAAVPAERLDAWQEYLRVRAQRLLEIPQLPEEDLWEIIESQHVAWKDLPPVHAGILSEDLRRFWPEEIHAR